MSFLSKLSATLRRPFDVFLGEIERRRGERLAQEIAEKERDAQQRKAEQLAVEARLAQENAEKERNARKREAEQLAQKALLAAERATREKARRNADEIAQHLGSKAVAFSRNTKGWPHCYYRVPFSIDGFWFRILVSPSEYVFAGERSACRLNDRSLTVPFCASLKERWTEHLVTMHLPRLSEELGIPVYTQEEFTECDVRRGLLTPTVCNLLRRIDLSPIRLIFLNSIQIHVFSELVSTKHCACQARLLQQLMLTVYQEQ